MLQQCFETWTMLAPGGSPYAVIAILDTIAAIKPNVATVAFGLVASTATVLLVSCRVQLNLALSSICRCSSFLVVLIDDGMNLKHNAV